MSFDRERTAGATVDPGVRPAAPGYAGPGAMSAVDRAATERERPLFGRRRFVETKSAFKTTELLALVIAAAGVLIAAAVADNLDAPRAWLLVAILVSAYMVSRGLAKAGKGTWQDD